MVYSYHLASHLGAEIGVVGFGATGLSRGGSGGVPELGISWNQLWDGVPRVFEPKPESVPFPSLSPSILSAKSHSKFHKTNPRTFFHTLVSFI